MGLFLRTVSYREPEYEQQRQADAVTEAGPREGGRSGALLPASPARAPEVIPWEGQVFEALGSCFMGRVPPPTPQLRREL